MNTEAVIGTAIGFQVAQTGVADVISVSEDLVKRNTNETNVILFLQQRRLHWS
jgi:hypothetical protein